MKYEDYNSLIVDSSGAVGYIRDVQTYELLHMTKAAMELYGIEGEQDYKGKKCFTIMQGLSHPCSFCRQHMHQGKQEHRWEYYNEKLKQWFDVTNFLIDFQDRRCRIGILRNITARKEADALSSGNLNMEDVLFCCLDIFTKERDIASAIKLFLASIGGYYQSDRAYLFEVDEEAREIEYTFEWHSTRFSPQKDQVGRLDIGILGEWRDRFERGEDVFIRSVEEEVNPETELYKILKLCQVESIILAPLRHEGKLIGFLGVDNPRVQIRHLVLLKSVSEFVLAELEKRRLTKELASVSGVDALTGLLNRKQFSLDLQEYDKSVPENTGVVSVDINGLKNINNTYGQDYGDYVINETAKTLRAHFRSGLYRVSGDEFVVLCFDLDKDAFQEKVIELRKRFDENREVDVSIGCSWSFDDANVSKLYQRADERRQGEKQFYYHRVLNEGHSLSLSDGFTTEVLKEIEEGRFTVYYQPQLDIKSGKVIGAEALVRKLDENGSLIPPNKFIPFYEVGGVISHIDLFVLRHACEAVRSWNKKGFALRISVNFSRMTLILPDIVERISGICEEYGVSPSSITVEVTESVSKIEDDQLKELIRELKARGFSISLDDFGSEYSNLAILSSMKFDEVKFDKTLVNTLEENLGSRVVMENSINMCRGLSGTSSLAEGIETPGQLELLLGYSCDYGQGYYFSRPVPLDEFTGYMQKRN